MLCCVVVYALACNAYMAVVHLSHYIFAPYSACYAIRGESREEEQEGGRDGAAGRIGAVTNAQTLA